MVEGLPVEGLPSRNMAWMMLRPLLIQDEVKGLNLGTVSLLNRRVQ